MEQLQNKRFFLFRVLFFFLFGCFYFSIYSSVWAQEAPQQVEARGDQFEYIVEENKMIAEGDVVVSKGDVVLTCDKMTLYRDTNNVEAQGNVVLRYGRSTIYGEKLSFNFDKMEGDFIGGRILADPYYGRGEKIAKVGENHIEIERGYITTCDLDKPHFRFESKKVDLYPKEKVQARHVMFKVGELPIFYLPQYTKDLRDEKQKLIFTPGYDKQWGIYLLTAYRYYLNDNFKGTLHLDAREKKDLAWGIDLDYRMQDYGKGIIRTYYMNERNITSNRWWQERPSPTIEKERFKVEWRHQWIIDQKTEALWQYYKLSDSSLLKDYFEREHERDTDPTTFFQLTKTLPSGFLSFRTDVRVNRFVSKVEKLPEVQYSMTNQQIGNTGLYFRNTSSYSNLVKKSAAPSEIRQNTMRIYTDNQISYPFKLGFIELNPYVGGTQTYYSKTKEKDEYDIIRGQFKTGASLSTKFYKIIDLQTDQLGLNINRLRHVITPSISYSFASRPTVPDSKIDNFESIDSLERSHTVNLSLENKLQTKREGESVDLIRAIVDTDFRLKEHTGGGGFDHVRADLEFRPIEWITFYWDADFDTRKDRLQSSNFELYFSDPRESDQWSLNFRKRWTRDVDDQIESEFNYIINPKWKLRNYYRFDIDAGLVKEQEYTVTRDLHCWEMDISYNETRGQGSEIWMVFRMKAFPEIGFDFSKSFRKRKRGTQSNY